MSITRTKDTKTKSPQYFPDTKTFEEAVALLGGRPNLEVVRPEVKNAIQTYRWGNFTKRSRGKISDRQKAKQIWGSLRKAQILITELSDEARYRIFLKAWERDPLGRALKKELAELRFEYAWPDSEGSSACVEEAAELKLGFPWGPRFFETAFGEAVKELITASNSALKKENIDHKFSKEALIGSLCATYNKNRTKPRRENPLDVITKCARFVELLLNGSGIKTDSIWISTSPKRRERDRGKLGKACRKHLSALNPGWTKSLQKG